MEAGFDGKKPTVRSPLWPLMPNGPAIDGTEEGLLDVPMKLVKQGCLGLSQKYSPDFAELKAEMVFAFLLFANYLMTQNLTCHSKEINGKV